MGRFFRRLGVRTHYLVIILCLGILFLGLSRHPPPAHDHRTGFPRLVKSSSFCTNLSFSAQLKTISWDSFDEGRVDRDLDKIEAFSELLLHKVLPFLVKPPTVPVNKSCLPPPLKIPSYTSYCKRIEQPRKVGVLIRFSFDVDALEIHLQELDAVVDKFFIIESIQSRGPFIKEMPLLWNVLKFDERFTPFIHKIVHFIVDDTYLPDTNDSSTRILEKELLQEKLRWTKFLEWNDAMKFFSSSDLLGFGDTDEIPNRDIIHYLKHCKFPSDPIDIGVWFPLDGINVTGVSPYKGHAYTVGDPSFWTLRKAKKMYLTTGVHPTRMRGKSYGRMMGGMHIILYEYQPLQIAKLLTAIGAKKPRGIIAGIIEAGKFYSKDQDKDAETKLNRRLEMYSKRIQRRNTFVTNGMTEAALITKIPWFIQCNRGRYPGLERKHDSRLQ